MKKNNPVDTFFHWLAAITLPMAFLLIIYYAYMLLYPFNVIDVYGTNAKGERVPNGVLTVLNPGKKVELGGTLRYEEDYCKYMALPAVTTVTLHNDYIVGLPVRQGNISVGCHKHLSIQKIPEAPLIVGKAFIEFVHTYRISSIRSVDEVSQTEEFEIVPKK
jgi:hypothetical protein